MAVDKAALFAPRLTEEDVEIDGLGTVRVRALSRAEVLSFRKQKAGDAEAMDRAIIAAGLVEPKLTEDEVQKWQEASPANELEAVTSVIVRLSGMDTGAAKEAVKRFRD